jgi:hypothetical protein
MQILINDSILLLKRSFLVKVPERGRGILWINSGKESIAA